MFIQPCCIYKLSTDLKVNDVIEYPGELRYGRIGGVIVVTVTQKYGTIEGKHIATGSFAAIDDIDTDLEILVVGVLKD